MLVSGAMTRIARGGPTRAEGALERSSTRWVKWAELGASRSSSSCHRASPSRLCPIPC